MAERLSKASRELLTWIGSCPQGVIDISDESVVRRLVDKGLVLKFFETTGSDLSPIWTITEAGRQALRSSDGGKDA